LIGDMVMMIIFGVVQPSQRQRCSAAELPVGCNEPAAAYTTAPTAPRELASRSWSSIAFRYNAAFTWGSRILPNPF
jgi:hypothetical protein